MDRIDRHASIKTGSKNTQDKREGGKYPFFVRSQEVERINTYSYNGEAVLTAGDGVGTGKVFHYIHGRFDVHQRVYRISNFSDRLDGRYFFFQFSERFRHRIMSMTAKSSVDSVRMETIAGMRIPLPPRREQRAIAAALSDSNELIRSLEALIAKKQATKQATMQQLLTGRTRLPGFGGEWAGRRLGELGAFRKGKGIRRTELRETGARCVRYGELYTRYQNYVVNPVSRIPKDVAATALRIEKGELLFAGSGETAEEIGICVAYIGEEPAYAGGDIIVLRAPGQDPVYLAHLLNAPVAARQKARMAQGDAVVHIRADHLAEIELPLPPVREQRAIAAVLSDMDAEIEALERRLDKARALKQGMMQQLLTGSIRLPIPEAVPEDDPGG
ncbi:restriction endonuclease subunit S [Candidatus Palauibacter sp.]|uniref:restriction endonuclease subunit S n=1 Tax=Candidatus Palauibacter sp. TaxID=3101350 RepID=UPI003AF30695